MTQLTKRIVDCSTGESWDEPLTVEEITQNEVAAATAVIYNAAAEAEAQAKAEAKAALLAKLGITEEDAKLLLS